jgi:hypothetical protein
MVALRFESPTPTAVALINGNDFASLLERAIARSQAPPKQIELRANETAAPVAWTGPLRGSNE